MSDRWKSLAEQLGAPGLEPTVRRPRDSSTTKPDPSSSRAPSPEGADAESTDETSDRPSQTESGDLRSKTSASGPAALPDQQWVKGEPPATAAESIGTEPPIGESESQDLFSSSQTLADNRPEPAPPPVEKRKRRSNWERLANLFSLSSDTRSEQEDQTPAPSDSVIDASTSDVSNPVLTEMFGRSDSSLPHESWQSPKRMVDDVGWEDDQEDSSNRKAEPEAAAGVEDPLSSDWLKEGKSSRGRFKRRRDRQTDSGFPSDERLEVKGETRREDSTTPWTDTESRRGTPETFESISRPQSASPERVARSTDESAVSRAESAEEGDGDEEFIAERRSSRRRRRRRDVTDNPEALGFERERSPAHLSREENDSADLEAVVENISEPDEERPEESLADLPSKRRRRRRRSRSTRRDLESGEISRDSESEDLTDETFDESSDDLDADPEELDEENRGAQKKHRNIPSWEESLAAIVDANIENHRRGDQRGYKGGGGRPRGRR